MCVCVSYQECIGAVSTDDPDADGLMLRFRTVSADVNGSQVDDAFAGGRKNTLRRTSLSLLDVKITNKFAVEEVIRFECSTVIFTACFCCHQKEIKKNSTDQNHKYVYFLSEFSFSSSLVSAINLWQMCVFAETLTAPNSIQILKTFTTDRDTVQVTP